MPHNKQIMGIGNKLMSLPRCTDKVSCKARELCATCSMATLRLAEIRQDGVDELEGLVDLLANLGTCKNDLAAHED